MIGGYVWSRVVEEAGREDPHVACGQSVAERNAERLTTSKVQAYGYVK